VFSGYPKQNVEHKPDIFTQDLKKPKYHPILSPLAFRVDALMARHAFLPLERLLNGPINSVRWRLTFVLKEPIRCYRHVDPSVVCHVLMHCLGSFLLQDVCFREAKYGKCEILRDMLPTCILYSVAGPGCLIRSICK